MKSDQRHSSHTAQNQRQLPQRSTAWSTQSMKRASTGNIICTLLLQTQKNLFLLYATALFYPSSHYHSNIYTNNHIYQYQTQFPEQFLPEASQSPNPTSPPPMWNLPMLSCIFTSCCFTYSKAFLFFHFFVEKETIYIASWEAIPLS